MNRVDALFNWLQSKVLADARPDDRAAAETREFFEDLLRREHGVERMEVAVDATMYTVRFVAGGKPGLQMFDRDAVEQLLRDVTELENPPKT
ncbi:MAG TPA: hypothetical protein VIK75_08615 [Calditerricola sp.]